MANRCFRYFYRFLQRVPYAYLVFMFLLAGCSRDRVHVPAEDAPVYRESWAAVDSVRIDQQTATTVDLQLFGHNRHKSGLGIVGSVATVTGKGADS